MKTSSLISTNMIATGLSENRVVISRNFSGPGVLVHKPVQTEFLTLYAVEIADLDANSDCLPENSANSPFFRIVVGDSSHALICSINDTDRTIIRNLCVDKDLEIWIAASTPNKYCVHGVVSNLPF